MSSIIIKHILMLGLSWLIMAPVLVRAHCTDIYALTHSACFDTITCTSRTAILSATGCGGGVTSFSTSYYICNPERFTYVTTSDCWYSMFEGSRTCSGSYTSTTLSTTYDFYTTTTIRAGGNTEECIILLPTPYTQYEVMSFIAGTVGTITARDAVSSQSSSSRTLPSQTVSEPKTNPPSDNTTTIIIAVTVVIVALIIAIATIVILRQRRKPAPSPLAASETYSNVVMDPNSMLAQNRMSGPVIYSPAPANVVPLNSNPAIPHPALVESNQYIPFAPPAYPGTK